MRPLYDDGSSDPSAVTRDYVFKLDTRRRRAAPPVLSIFGGKITTYRKLAEHALARARAVPSADEAALDAHARRFPAATCLPGGRTELVAELTGRYSGAPGRAAARPRAPARHARAGDPGRREDAGRSGRGLRSRAHRARDRLPRATRNGRAAATTCCGGGPSAASACREAERDRVAAVRRAGSRTSRVTLRSPLATMPGRRAPRDPRRAHRHRRHAVDARPTDRRGVRRDGAAARRRQARHPDHRPARRLVRSHRADVAGRRGRRRERRVLHALRRRGAQARAALRRRRADAARPSRRGSRPSRDRILARGAGLRARVRPALSRDATSRSISARTCRRLPRAAVDRIVAMMEAEGMTAKVSSIHVNGWFGSYDKLTMTQQLLAEAFGDRHRRGARRIRVRRRFAERCADVRVLSRTRSASPTCASSPIASPRCRPMSRAPRRARDSRSSRTSCWLSRTRFGSERRDSSARHQLRASAARPAKRALAPSASSMRSAFVPFRHALGARERADLELAGVPADREMHDRDVLGFAGARRDDRAEARGATGSRARRAFRSACPPGWA